MRVYHIGSPRLTVQPVDEVVSVSIQVIPQLFLGNIGVGSCLDAHDTRVGRQRLLGFAIIRGNVCSDYPPGHQVDLFHVCRFGQRAGQVNDIFGLPTGIRITTQLQIGGANQAVDADQQQV